MIIRASKLLPALCAVAAGGACAQGGQAHSLHDSVPPLHYRSAFADYQPYSDSAVADWRTANDRVRTLNGHVGHAGAGPDAAGPAPDAGRNATPAQKQAPRGQDHSGHPGGRP